jgi:hypothetical protein
VILAGRKATFLQRTPLTILWLFGETSENLAACLSDKDEGCNLTRLFARFGFSQPTVDSDADVELRRFSPIGPHTLFQPA